MNRKRGSTPAAANISWRLSSRVFDGGRVPAPRSRGFDLASHAHIAAAATTDTSAATAPLPRDGSRGFCERRGRGRAVQQRSLSDAVVGPRPRSADPVEVGDGDVVASQASQVRLELLHLWPWRV